MQADQPKLLPILGIGCVLFIVILVILWPYHDLIGFLAIGLAVFTILVLLGIRIMQAVADVRDKFADVKGKENEQGLRRSRLRPFHGGQYEIPLDNGETYMPPLQKRRQEPYSEGYDGDDPKDSSNKGWD